MATCVLTPKAVAEDWPCDIDRPLELLQTIHSRNGQLRGFKFSSDGKDDAAAGDRLLSMFTVETGMRFQRFSENELEIHRLAFSPNGQWGPLVQETFRSGMGHKGVVLECQTTSGTLDCQSD